MNSRNALRGFAMSTVGALALMLAACKDDVRPISADACAPASGASGGACAPVSSSTRLDAPAAASVNAASDVKTAAPGPSHGGGPSVPASPASTSAASSPEPGETSQDSFEGTAGMTEKKRPGFKGAAVLRDVRAGRHGSFDRVVFAFQGAELPGYHIEYLAKPAVRCGSGDATEIAGQGRLEVRISPAQAHDGAGKPTVTDRERSPKLPVLQEIEQTCDFEGQVTWVLGVSSANRYRVLELLDPPRLVVDVKH